MADIDFDKIELQKNRTVSKHILAGVLTFLFVLSLVLTVALGILRTTVSKNIIRDMIQNVDLQDIVIDDESEKEKLEQLGLKCDSSDLFNIIYDNIDQSKMADPLTKDELQSIVKHEAFREYFGDIISDNVDSLISGETTDVVAPSDVVDFLRSEKDAFSEILGYELTEERLGNLQNALEQDYRYIFEELSNKNISDFADDENADIIRVLFSDWLFTVCVIMDLIFVVLILFVLRSVSFGTRYCGISISFVGLLYLTLLLLINFGWLGVNTEDALVFAFNQLINVILWKAIAVAITLIVVGVMIALSMNVINRYRKKRK